MTVWLLGRAATMTAVVLLSLALGTGVASAHPGLAGSEPAEGQVLIVAPQRVTLTFTEAVQPGFALVEVRGAGGTPVSSGTAEVVGPVVTQPVTLTGNGSYLVAYRIVAGDGHPVTGDLTFDYAGSAASNADPSLAAGPRDVSTRGGAPEAEAFPDEPATAQGVAPGLWWGLGGSVVGLAVLAALALRRRGADA